MDLATANRALAIRGEHPHLTWAEACDQAQRERDLELERRSKARELLEAERQS